VSEANQDIRDALANVEGDGPASESLDPKSAVLSEGEEPDARPEGPLPNDEPGDDQGGFSVLSWAKSVPEGSHLDFDRRDWWDPEGGGENRLAFHLSTIADEGGGYPNGVGVLVALGELYYSEVLGRTDDVEHDERGDDERDDQDAPDAEEVPAETAEGLV
jgi:hypothetical protein